MQLLALLALLCLGSAHFSLDHTHLDDEPRYWPNHMRDYVPGDPPTISNQSRAQIATMFQRYTEIVMNQMWPPGSTGGDSTSWDCYGGR